MVVQAQCELQAVKNGLKWSSNEKSTFDVNLSVNFKVVL